MYRKFCPTATTSHHFTLTSCNTLSHRTTYSHRTTPSHHAHLHRATSSLSYKLESTTVNGLWHCSEYRLWQWRQRRYDVRTDVAGGAVISILCHWVRTDVAGGVVISILCHWVRTDVACGVVISILCHRVTTGVAGGVVISILCHWVRTDAASGVVISILCHRVTTGVAGGAVMLALHYWAKRDVDYSNELGPQFSIIFSRENIIYYKYETIWWYKINDRCYKCYKYINIRKYIKMFNVYNDNFTLLFSHHV